ncbi:hypothetical protein [Nocardia sp. NBC_01327]|uniref:hypothetical protein n=1 Tax=Nocardia sp. NBC_01327 TaxID=2903593 RepID=UPI002E165BDD|nr:hypothetical protein OG326_22805 [Nocardia sp. NBC_01327]
MIKCGARGELGLILLAACALLTACGGTEQHTRHSSSVEQAPISALPQPSSTTAPTPAASAAVGEVPGNPRAAAALRPWVRDLIGADIDQLIGKCWTIEPAHAREMYADKADILAAVAQPGIDGQFAVIWKGPVRSVSVKRAEIASGYACPYVDATGSVNSYTEADARYAVQRYLSRWVGKPVDADDVEGKYPLVCTGSVLADNPGRLTGVTAFGALTSRSTGDTGVEVSGPVTNSSNVTQPMTFTLSIGAGGYCIGNISG